MKLDSILDILIVPPIADPSLRDKTERFMPVGLLVLLSCLKKNNFHGKIFKPEHLLLLEKDYKIVATKILSYHPEVIGFSTWCHFYPSNLLLANQLKQFQPEVPIIFGGPQASILAKETMQKFESVDYVLSGEAEYSIIQLLMAIKHRNINELKEIPGLTYRDPTDKNKIISNRTTKLNTSLDELPIPLYEELNTLHDYLLDAGRGCPFKCTYCTTNQFFSKNYRTKSPDRIIQEMDICYKLSGGRTHFGFANDMFTLNKKFIDELCNKLIERKIRTGIKYTWTCSARTDCVSEKMLNKMAEAGCRGIFFGVESGSERIQKMIKKNLNIQHAHNIILSSTRLKIETTASYMVGFPTETKNDLESTLKSLINVIIRGAKPQILILSLLPGTPMYSEHHHKVIYDGHISGFSNKVFNSLEEKMVRDHKDLFSSFYYLPNKNISREVYIFISEIASLLSDFIPTFMILGKYLNKDLINTSLLKYIEDHISKYANNPSVSSPEYFFLVDSISAYLTNNKSIQALDFIREVFYIDCIKAFLKIKYFRFKRPQIIRHAEGKLNNTKRTKKEYLSVSPFMQVLSTNNDISSIYESIRKGREFTGSPKMTYWYLVICNSLKKSSLFRIRPVDMKLIKAIESRGSYEMSEFIADLNLNDYQKRSLNKIIKMGAVQKA